VLALVEEEITQIPAWDLIQPLVSRVMLPAALLLSLFVGGQAAGQWEGLIRALNPIPFGIADPLFEREVSFYIFSYPFLLYVYQFSFLTLSIALLAVAAARSLALDRFARRARGLGVTPQGAVDFGGEARQGVEEHVAVEAIQHALALALAHHEPCALQHGQMARDGRRAERETFREIGSGERGLRQERNDLPPRNRG